MYIKTRTEFINEQLDTKNNNNLINNEENLLNEGVIMDNIKKGLTKVLLAAAITAGAAGAAKSQVKLPTTYISSDLIEHSNMNKINKQIKSLLKEIEKNKFISKKSGKDFEDSTMAYLRKMYDENFYNELSNEKKLEMAKEIADIYAYCMLIDIKEGEFGVNQADKYSFNEVKNVAKLVYKSIGMNKEETDNIITAMNVSSNPIFKAAIERGIKENVSKIEKMPIYEMLGDKESKIVGWTIYENNKFKGLKKA